MFYKITKYLHSLDIVGLLLFVNGKKKLQKHLLTFVSQPHINHIYIKLNSAISFH